MLSAVTTGSGNNVCRLNTTRLYRSGINTRAFARAADSLSSTRLRSVLVGAPGSGKGTHAASIMKRWPSVQSIVSGNLLRQEMAEETPLGRQAAEVMRQGGLLPDEIMIDLVRLFSWMQSVRIVVKRSTIH